MIGIEYELMLGESTYIDSFGNVIPSKPIGIILVTTLLISTSH